MKLIEEIEILRAFAILGVVSLHVGFDGWSFNESLVLIIKTVVRLCYYPVPLFILISGFVLGLKYTHYFSIIDFYKKRALSIVPSYIIFTFIFIHFSDWIRGSTEPITLLRIIHALIIGLDDLWFLVVLIQLYLLYPFLIRFSSGHHFNNNPLKFVIYILLIHLCWDFLKTDFAGLINRNDGFLSNVTYHYILRRSFLNYLFYFVLGIYVSNNFNAIKHQVKELKINYLLLLILPHIALGLFKLHLTIPPVYIKFLVIFFRLLLIIASIIFFFKISIMLVESKSHLKKLFAFIGKYSFGIYLMHSMFIRSLYQYGFNKSYHYKWEFYLFIFVFSILFSIFISKLISFFPYGNFVVGSKIKTSQ